MLAALALLVACRAEDPPATPSPRAEMPIADRARRVSLAIRGVPPSPEELAAVVADPAALADQVDGWLDSPEFAETVRDMHAELLWTRVDTEFEYPSAGTLAGTPQGVILASVGEAPLKLVEDVVMGDRPYTDVLTADYTMTDATLAEMYGLDFDPAGPAWQRATWRDGRPAAGLLSDNSLFLRHRSSDTNFERERANAVSRIFLCADFAAADIPVVPADALPDAGPGPATDPLCRGCHATLDPLGSFFWGYDRYILPSEVRTAYRGGCEGDDQKFCYPFDYYVPAREGLWDLYGMPEPALYGAPGGDLADLGRLLTARPEFSTCAARHFASFLTETPLDALPATAWTRWGAAFVASGYDAKALVREIVLDPGFVALRDDGSTDFVAGVQQVRPEQYARTIEHLTGFRFVASETPDACATGDDDCWGDVDLVTSDRYGLRTLLGGMSGYRITAPTWTPTPTRELALERIADEAAGWVVSRDLPAPPDEELLLHADPTTIAPGSVAAAIADLWSTLLGEDVGPDDPGVQAALSLWTDADATGGPTAAWREVVSALLLHPRMVTY